MIALAATKPRPIAPKITRATVPLSTLREEDEIGLEGGGTMLFDEGEAGS